MKKSLEKTDLASVYHQVEMHIDYHHKTAFKTILGLFEYVFMLLGVRNAPSIFQKLIYNIFREALDHFCTVFLDDILI